MEIGDKLQKEFIVLDKHSAKNIGSGDLEVLSSPGLIAFMEETARDLLAKKLDDKLTSVGSYISLEHLAVSKIGAMIKVEVDLISIEKDRIFNFEIIAHDGDKIIGKAKHTRVLVDKERFIKKL